MKKFLSLFAATLFSVVMFADAEGGTLSSSPALTDPSATVLLTYDGAGTNFAAWEPKCFIHAWLVAADGQNFSKAYETEWIDCNGDAQYESIAANRKMTYAGVKDQHDGKYTISMNIKEFFGVADEDLAKIAKLGVIVCSQYNGKEGEKDKNKTKELYIAVAEGGDTPECKDGPYGLIFNGKDTIVAKAFDELDFEGRKQYQADSVVVKAGDKFVVANLSCDAKWVMNVEDAGAAADFEKSDKEYTAKKDGMFVFFIKMKMDDDLLYIGEIKDEGGDTKLENGFYLISAAQEWKVENLKAEQKFAVNPDNDKEFVLKGVKLAEGDKIKVVKVENEAIVAWYPDGEGTEYTVDAKHAGDNKDIYFQEEYKEDWKAFGGFFWTGENGEGGGAKLENGFYLISEALEWKVENLTADLKFDANPGAENEFMKKTRLSEGAKIKVVKVEADAAVKWYPDGNETEYVVDAAHAGDVTIYFQEEKKSDWEEFGGFFFIVAEGGEGIDNTVVEAVAVKMIENGMLIIEKAGVRYNVMGQVIR